MPQVVIGTPGTLKRWLTKDRILEPDNLRILVFDEADHMLDQDGFKDDSIRLLREITRRASGLQVGYDMVKGLQENSVRLLN